MADPFDRLEAELASLKPVAMSDRLADAIAHELAEASRWSIADRCLAGAASLGAIAACAIVGIVTWNVLMPQNFAPPTSVIAQTSTPTLGQFQQALARGPDSTVELFR